MKRTIDIRHRPVILVLHEHIAKLNLHRVHVLPRDEQLLVDAVTLVSSCGEDVVDLGGDRGWEGGEDVRLGGVFFM